MFRTVLALAVCAVIAVSSSASAADFTFRDVVTLIEAGKIQRLEHLIRRLPDELRTNYVLMSSSRSSHRATGIRPRVILASADAKLLMAFSGVPDDPAYDKLELIQFRDETDTFEFREIEFSRQHAPVISAANPVGCKGCHQESLRPNWEPGLSWKGAIGDGPLLHQQEANSLQSFSKLKEYRYETLLRAESAKAAQPGRQSPAAQLATKINQLNQRRIARQLYNLPDYERYKFAVVATLVGSPFVNDMLPNDPEHGVTRRRLESRKAQIEASFRKSGVGWWQTQQEDAEGIARLHLLLEWQKHDPAEASTSFESASFLTTDSRKDFNAVLTRLFELDLALARAADLPVGWESMDRTGKNDVWGQFLERLEKRNWEAQNAPPVLRTAAR